jgi:heterotetrameric sarcosine oxidase gamma subunit
MSNATSGPVVRRSALETAHVALGARWLAEHVRWPEGYGSADMAAQTSAVANGAGLAEIGPLDEFLLRGPGTLAAAERLATDDQRATVGRAIVADLSGEPGAVWVLGSDEALVLAPGGGSAIATLILSLSSEDVSAIEMTGARTSLRLAGPAAPAILAELCPADTTPTKMTSGDLVQAPLAGVRAFIARQDAGSYPGYTIMVARDEAAYVWDALVRIGEPQGLTAVGPAVLGGVGIS